MTNITLPLLFLLQLCRKCTDCGSRTPGSGQSSRWHANYTVCDSCYQQRNKGLACPICGRAYRHSAQKEMMQCATCKRYLIISTVWAVEICGIILPLRIYVKSILANFIGPKMANLADFEDMNFDFCWISVLENCKNSTKIKIQRLKNCQIAIYGTLEWAKTDFT